MSDPGVIVWDRVSKFVQMLGRNNYGSGAVRLQTRPLLHPLFLGVTYSMSQDPSQESLKTWEQRRFGTEEQRRFWNSWNTSHREHSVKLPEVNSRQARMAIEWISSVGRKDLDILEVGCGSGWFCRELLDFGRVTGTDLSDEVLARSRESLPEVSFIAGDFVDVPFAAASFDFIVSLEVLAHVVDQQRFVQQIAELLRPGGSFVIATQNRFALTRWSEVSAQSNGQIRKWVDVRTLRQLLSAHFEIAELTSIHPVGDRGILRWINAPKINRLLSVFASRSTIQHLKERWFLGHTLMALVRKPIR